MCIFCTWGKVETKKHFILECDAFKAKRDSYVHALVASSWDNLFSKGFMEKLGALIIMLHKKRVESRSQFVKGFVP